MFRIMAECFGLYHCSLTVKGLGQDRRSGSLVALGLQGKNSFACWQQITQCRCSRVRAYKCRPLINQPLKSGSYNKGP